MALTLFTAPAVEPITVAEVRERIAIGDETDETIAALIAAAREHIDGPDGYLGRALINQTWDLWLDRFPSRCRDGRGWIELPLAPVQSVTHVKYIDSAGVLQTMVVDTDYQLDLKSQPGRILPPYCGSFPCPREVPNAVTVRSVAGYGAPATSIPHRIRQELLQLVEHWIDDCECREGPVPAGMDAELANYKLF